MSYIQTRDGEQIFVRDIGKRSKPDHPTIILLHGFGMQSLHWLPFAAPLALKYRFLIPDLRGFGQSHLVTHNQPCVISNYADDLDDIISHFKLSNFKLVGISMGAFVALQYQGTYGTDKISHYLHIDQSPKCINGKSWQWGLFGDENQDRLSRASTLVNNLTPYVKSKTPYDLLPINLRNQLWRDLGDFFASALSRTSHKKLARKICSKEKLICRLMPVNNWPTYIHCLKAYIEQNYDMQSILERIDTPISLLVGMKSEMYPCGGQLRIADYHSDCEIIPFQNSGHTPLIDQPFRFFYELKRFAGL